ncbi:MAG: glycosyltransferase [Chloroflexi bacterium]|nr:MAG: glycosyltransferase [Chloroflexota bacterium]
MTASFALTLLVALAAVPALGSALYLLLLAVASCFHRPAPARAIPRHRLTVLIPAHNEAQMVTGCVQSLKRQSYPTDLYRVVVIADNCTDETAELAARAGAEVLIRNEPGLRGKGHALRWGIDRILGDQSLTDALVVVDADSLTESHFLAELEARLADGYEAVQADDLVLPQPGSQGSVLEATALLLRNRVRFAGRTVIGLPAMLYAAVVRAAAAGGCRQASIHLARAVTRSGSAAPQPGHPAHALRDVRRLVASQCPRHRALGDRSMDHRIDQSAPIRRDRPGCGPRARFLLPGSPPGAFFHVAQATDLRAPPWRRRGGRLGADRETGGTE